MKKSGRYLFIILFVTSLLYSLISCKDEDKNTNQPVQTVTDKSSKHRILYVDSYSLEFPWIQGITRGILETLNISMDGNKSLDCSQSLYDLKIYHMKTKRNSSSESIDKAVQEILSIIMEWKPEVIITSDDNAAKYLVVPHLMDFDIPIVFCGINWDASIYGFPTDNITGMIEVNLIDKMVEELKRFSTGERIGYLRDNATTSIKESENYEKLLGSNIKSRYPTTYGQWKDDFLALQKEVDILLIGYPNGLEDWDGDTEAYQSFLREHTRIPTGSWDRWSSGWVLMSFALNAEEQGEFAAATAIRVLNGESPGNIPVIKNQKAKVFLNMGMAKKLGIVFPMDLIERSTLIENWLND